MIDFEEKLVGLVGARRKQLVASRQAEDEQIGVSGGGGGCLAKSGQASQVTFLLVPLLLLLLLPSDVVGSLLRVSSTVQ